MKYLLLTAALAGTACLGVAYGQTTTPASQTENAQPAVPVQAMMLGTVRIPQAVRANDGTLSAGTYRIRLTGNAVEAVAGETPHLEQWVEFIQSGQVKGKAVASIVPAESIQQVAEGPIPRQGRARVDILNDHEYVRIWINRNGDSYLLHLPPA